MVSSFYLFYAPSGPSGPAGALRNARDLVLIVCFITVRFEFVDFYY